jgi:hypothetical protein
MQWIENQVQNQVYLDDGMDVWNYDFLTVEDRLVNEIYKK